MSCATASQSTPVAVVAACRFPALRGSQVLIRQTAEDLARHGREVHLVTYPDGDDLSLPEGLQLHGCAVPFSDPRRRHRGWRKLLADVGLLYSLYDTVVRYGVQTIHAHNYEAPVAAYIVRWLTGASVVYHSHNVLSDELATYVSSPSMRWLARRIGGLLDRQVPRRADAVIALTEDIAAFLRSNGVDPERIYVIPPPVEPSAGSQPRDAGDEFVVAYAGNLDGYQDLEVLFRGFALFRSENQNAILRFITHEANWSRRAGKGLVGLVEAGCARVVVARTYRDVEMECSVADVLVCPRSSWSGFPIKLLNYMATGRPIIAAAGSAKGIVDGETGLVFDNGDAGGLASALRRLWKDSDLRQHLGANARAEVVDRHDRGRISSEIEAIHAKLCGQRVWRENSTRLLGAPGRSH